MKPLNACWIVAIERGRAYASGLTASYFAMTAA